MAKINVSTGAAAGAAVVVVWVFSLAGIVVPADVAVTIAAGLVWLAGLLAAKIGPKQPTTPDKGGDVK